MINTQNMKTLLKCLKVFSGTTILCLSTFILHAQKETELFIPVGKSPGVSGEYSIVGRVESVNLNDSTLMVRLDTGIRKVRIIPGADIYLDKSKFKLTNTKGKCGDIKPGMLVEVKFLNNKPDGFVEWCKVKIE